MSDIAKYLERAEKHLQKGRRDAALREYLEALEQVPGHEVAMQAAADLHLSLGHLAEGIGLLHQVLERQVVAGQVQAAATYKKLLRMGAVTPEQSMDVARLLQPSSRKDALEAYQIAVRGFLERVDKAEALVALEGIVALEPTAENLLRVAQLAAELRDVPRAVSALVDAGNIKAAAAPQEALQCYARAYALDPASVLASLAYARSLLSADAAQNAAKSASVLQPYARGPLATPATRATYGLALLHLGRAREAVPFLPQVLDQDPAHLTVAVALISRLLAQRETLTAVELAQHIEAHQRAVGRLREFSELMRAVEQQHTASLEFLEYIVELFNATNREQDYCRALLRLFELYYADGNFLKAGECLDRAAEVDPYEDGHKRRLDMLRGKLDANRLRAIAGRLIGAVTTADEKIAHTVQSDDDEPTVLEDLMLQAEIFLQYSLRSRAAERLERIRKLFPGEEEHNNRLRDLYAAAGFLTPAEPEPVSAKGDPRTVRPGGVDNISRITEITGNIYRQSSVKSVLFTAVNETGRHWKASRCIAVLCSPGKPPSVALEYCAPGTKPSDVHAIVKLIGLLQPLVIAHGPLVVGGDAEGPGLAALRHSAAGMGIRSMLAMPLVEGEEHVGLLVLAQCELVSTWGATDLAVLKTIADQSVLAVSNVRLRSLVRNLAITEEKSGLLKRVSYLDVLLSEVRRAAAQKSTVSVLLLNFGKTGDLLRQMGEGALETLIQQLGQLVCSHIRQNDLAVRYDLTTLALVLADTNERSAFLAADKLRKVLANARVPAFSGGIAEAVMEPDYDPVDIVTELINRVEAALQAALAEGGNATRALPPALADVDAGLMQAGRGGTA